MMKKNGKAMGTYCSLYDQPVDSSHGTYSGGWSGNTHFQVESSWTYELKEQDNGVKN
jgi:hypothetical protein